jgi:hypothetical protein
MRLFAAALLAMIVGCESAAVHPAVPQVTDSSTDLFSPTLMRLHPIFTQVENFSGGSKPEGIEAVLEFDDQFGDPTKAAGSVIFELYSFRTGYPDPRGKRLTEPWAASIKAVEQQRAHWRREISSYSFLLAYDEISADRNYVLTATFEPLDGQRLFAETIIEGQGSATQPSSVR